MKVKSKIKLVVAWFLLVLFISVIGFTIKPGYDFVMVLSIVASFTILSLPVVFFVLGVIVIRRMI